MKRTTEITLDQIGSKSLSTLAKGAKLSLDVPMSCTGSTNNPIDIASDYAWVLFAAELLAPHVTSLSHLPATIGHAHSERLVFTLRNPTGCAAALRRIKLAFDQDQPPESEDARIEALEFESALTDYPHVSFPELGDSFLANYVHGLEATFGDDELEQCYCDFPTWRYGFWKSFLSQEAGADLYASIDAWILPHTVELSTLLRYLGWKGTGTRTILHSAQSVRIGSLPWILASDSLCVRVPTRQLSSAAQCWYQALSATAQPARQSSGSAIVDAETDYLSTQPEAQWSVSEDGSIVSVGLADVQFLTFLEPSSKVRPEDLRVYLRAAEDSRMLLSAHCGLPESPLDWTQLDPNAFEELCYDTLLRCERFDPIKMRKLGSALSRDGGRDIEAWTQTRPGAPAKKWIYQCKFSATAGRSLAGSKVAISDVVDQYSADGFGVMTNLVIDATLYDKLDGIAKTRSQAGRALLVDTWSVYELERFLYPKRDLLARYFGHQRRRTGSRGTPALPGSML